MTNHAQECLKRAAECGRQAEATSDSHLKLYLMKLALSWTQAAAGEMATPPARRRLDVPARSSKENAESNG
jgi:hypothetical protein